MGGCVKPPIVQYKDDDQSISQYDGNITISSLDSSILSTNESDINCNMSDSRIPVIITARQPYVHQPDRVQTCKKSKVSANITINRKSKKLSTATQLPIVVNLNPRSIYNKKEEFRTTG